MKSVRFLGSIKKDLKRIKRRHYDTDKLAIIFDLLCASQPLTPAMRAHLLHGEWYGFWECHVAPDWLLIYKITDTEILIARTGTHADIFG
jgi:mRNA interferase YafQ